MAASKWRRGDRVVVKKGEHAGRHGTINMLPDDDLAPYYGLMAPQVRVALDGESAQGSQGGRGGVPINIHPTDLEHEPS